MNLFELYVKIAAEDKASKTIGDVGKSSEALNTKMYAMAVRAANAQKKVDELSQQLNDSAKKTGVASEETQELADKLSKAEKEAEEARADLDKLNTEVEETSEASERASGGLSKLADKLGSGLKTAAKGGATAIAAAASGLAALTAASVKSYADYEQLVGGVETLFKSSASTVQGDADNAYRTAGLSANDYMETVTSFSASLLQSLDGDTAEAAKKADMAITDMSDNANKMGTDMASIQSAYQGFAKQNYTMLDNLKLGYGGTKEEMERLLEDAEKLDGSFKLELDEDGNLVYSYADIVDAIHIVQNEMGITGTTAKEASTTIQGSLNSMKAAWSNVLTGIADENQNFDALIGNLVDSAETFGDNIIPRVETALDGAAALIDGLAPKISERLPELVSDLLPELVGSGARIIESLVTGISESSDAVVSAAFRIISTLGESVVSMLPEIGELGLELLMALTQGLTENADSIADTAAVAVRALADGIAEAAPVLIPAAVELVLSLAAALTSPDMIDALLGSASDIVLSLADGIINSVPLLLEQIPTLMENLVYGLISYENTLFETAIKLVGALIKGITDPQTLIKLATLGIDTVLHYVSGLVSGAVNVLKGTGEIFNKVKEGFMKFIKDPIGWGRDLVDNFIRGIKEKWESLKETVSGIAGTVKDFLGFSEPKEGPLSNFHTYAPDMMELFAKGIRDNERVVTDQIEKSFDFGTRTVDADFAVKGSKTVTPTAAQRRNVSFGTVNITVNGARYSDENSLAEAVADALTRMVEREEGVYA